MATEGTASIAPRTGPGMEDLSITGSRRRDTRRRPGRPGAISRLDDDRRNWRFSSASIGRPGATVRRGAGGRFLCCGWDGRHALHRGANIRQSPPLPCRHPGSAFNVLGDALRRTVLTIENLSADTPPGRETSPSTTDQLHATDVPSAAYFHAQWRRSTAAYKSVHTL